MLVEPWTTSEVCFSSSSGKAVPMLYGGSVDETNCAHYARLPQAAGMGVGRAGLSPERFWAVLTEALAARMC
jgi:triosephosphate isomerase